MQTNIGLFDRIVRIAGGTLLVALALFGEIGVWGYIGLLPLVTGLLGLSPLYFCIDAWIRGRT
jgi:hypothetical protein